jgi:hypothetical protein
MYWEPNTRFSPKHFSLFVDIFEHINDKLCMTRWKESTFEVEYVAFFIGSKLYMLHVTNWTKGAISFASKEAWAEIVNSMKE